MSSGAEVDGAHSENKEVLNALRASCRTDINVAVSEVSPELVSSTQLLLQVFVTTRTCARSLFALATLCSRARRSCSRTRHRRTTSVPPYSRSSLTVDHRRRRRGATMMVIFRGELVTSAPRGTATRAIVLRLTTQHWRIASHVRTRQIHKARELEVPEIMEKEPLGWLIFTAYCRKVDCAELIYFLNEATTYESIPVGTYRAATGKKIIAKYITVGAKQQLALPDLCRMAIEKKFDTKGALKSLFATAKIHVYAALRASVFPHFLYSRYYVRLLSYRARELKPVGIDDFDYLRVLGQGGFGKVFAVSKKDTLAAYACKTLNKLRVVQRHRESLIVNERNILAVVDHPFIVNLKYAFQVCVITRNHAFLACVNHLLTLHCLAFATKHSLTHSSIPSFFTSSS
jgi:hypothetical protein